MKWTVMQISAGRKSEMFVGGMDARFPPGLPVECRPSAPGSRLLHVRRLDPVGAARDAEDGPWYMYPTDLIPLASHNAPSR